MLLAVAGFVAAQHVQLQRLALDRAVAQGEAAGLAVLAFHFGHARVLLPGSGFATHFLDADGQAQPLGQRPGGACGQAVAVAGVAVAHFAAQGHAAVPFGLCLAGDDVDHPADGFRAVQRGHRPAHHLDALDLLDADPAVLVVRVADGVVGGGNAPTVDQHQGVTILGAANAERLAPADLPPVEADARRAAQSFEQVGGAARLDLLGGDDGHCRRGIGQGLRAAGGSDHHRVEFGRASGQRRRRNHDACHCQRVPAHVHPQERMRLAGSGIAPWLAEKSLDWSGEGY